MKLTKQQLEEMQKDGVRVQRAMGKQPKPKAPPKPKPAPPKPKPAPKPPEPPADYAAMRSSMAATERLLEQNARILEHNNEVIQQFASSVKELKPLEPSAYTFDLERDDDKLLKRVYARPGIIEG